MKVIHNKETNQYEINGEVLTFEQLEAFSAEIQKLIGDEYSRSLSDDLLGDGVCDSCMI